MEQDEAAVKIEALEETVKKYKAVALKLRDRCRDLEEEAKVKDTKIQAMTDMNAELTEATLILSDLKLQIKERNIALHEYEERLQIRSEELEATFVRSEEKDKEIEALKERIKRNESEARLREQLLASSLYQIGLDFQNQRRTVRLRNANTSWLNKHRAQV